MAAASPKKSDVRRLESLLTTAGRLVDQMDDAAMRGLIGNWNGDTTGVSLRDQVAEFHDWQSRKLASIVEGSDG